MREKEPHKSKSWDKFLVIGETSMKQKALRQSAAIINIFYNE